MKTEPDTYVVLGCIALGLAALILSGALLGWELCRRWFLRRMQKVDLINAAGEHKTVLLLEE